MHEAPKIEIAVGRQSGRELRFGPSEAPDKELDAEGGGAKTWHRVELLRIQDIYWTAPSTLRAKIAAPNVSHSLCLRFPHTAHLPREPILCLHFNIAASALDIIKRLRLEQHSPCNGT